MSNYNSLKTTINANVKQNGVQAITGQILNAVLNAMVNTLGAGYQFAGVATTATNPGSPDAKVFYIANGKGTYTNFGGISVTEDDVVVLYWDSSWHKVSTGIASQAKLSELESGKADKGLVIETERISYDETLGEESPFFVENKLIWTTSGKWVKAGIESPYRAGMAIYRIPAYAEVTINARSDRAAYYYMLADIDIVIGETPHTLDGYSSAITIDANSVGTTPAIDTDYYLAVRRYNNSGVNYSPTSMRIEGENVIEHNRISENTEGISSNAERIESLSGAIYEERTETIDESLDADGKFYHGSMLFWTQNGKWAKEGVESPYKAGMLIYHIPKGLQIEVTARPSRNAYCYMLSDLDGIEIGGTPHLVSETSEVISVSSGTSVSLPVVNQDYYLAVRNYSNSGIGYSPAAMTIEGTLTEVVNRIDDNARKIGAISYKSRYNHGSWGLKPFEFDKGYYQCGQTTIADDLNIQREHNTDGIYECVNTYQDVLSWMDALMEMQNVSNTTITKRAIGTSSDNQTMYEYVFANKRYSVTGLPSRQQPIILIDACIHGFEKNSFFGWYAFLKDMLTNTDNEFLDAISRNIEIHFCPCVNPYGFDHNSYLNANSVNINRNFDTSNWEYVPSGSDASGEEPFDQPESQAIRDWVLTYPKAMMLFTTHTNGRITNGYDEMNACMSQFGDDEYYNRLADVFRRHIEIQTQYIPRIYELNIGSSFCGRYQYSASHGGVETSWVRESADMLAMTLEMFNQLRVNGAGVFGAFLNLGIKCCAEICGNILGQFLSEYAE